MKAIITGASSGIGQAIAQQLASEGWQIATATRNEDAVNQIKNVLSIRHPNQLDPIVLRADLSQPKDLDIFLKKVELAWDTPDLIICNLGSFSPDLPSSMNIEILQSQVKSSNELGDLITRNER